MSSESLWELSHAAIYLILYPQKNLLIPYPQKICSSGIACKALGSFYPSVCSVSGGGYLTWSETSQDQRTCISVYKLLI